MDLFLRRLEEEVLSVKEQVRNYSNLSREEIKVLLYLKNYRDVVIKPADKGSIVVVWDLKEHREEAYAQLGELEVYEKVGNNPIKELNEKVITKLKDLKDKGVISDENRACLKPDKETKNGKFYLLPKIHKRLLKVPGRPVVSISGTSIEKILEFFDFFLQPVV